MHGMIGQAATRVPRVHRRIADWTLKEHEVVVSHWPDVDEIGRRLPHRTRKAIQAFAGKCNLRKPIHFWTDEQNSLLRRRVREGVPAKEIAREIGLTKLQVTNRMRYIGLTYPRRPPKPCGNEIVDAIKKRAFVLNISMKELDEACRSGGQFQRYAPCRKIHIKHIVKATRVLDGNLTIRWNEL